MKTIVVVDDEFDLVDVLSATLSDLGYQVHAAANGVDGLEAIADHLPDLVLLDFMMPLLDGAQVLAQMQRVPELASIPVILMSSMPEYAIRTRCHGYTLFLRKPFDFDALTHAVQAVLGTGT